MTDRSREKRTAALGRLIEDAEARALSDERASQREAVDGRNGLRPGRGRKG